MDRYQVFQIVCLLGSAVCRYEDNLQVGVFSFQTCLGLLCIAEGIETPIVTD